MDLCFVSVCSGRWYMYISATVICSCYITCSWMLLVKRGPTKKENQASKPANQVTQTIHRYIYIYLDTEDQKAKNDSGEKHFLQAVADDNDQPANAYS